MSRGAGSQGQVGTQANRATSEVQHGAVEWPESDRAQRGIPGAGKVRRSKAADRSGPGLGVLS